MDNKLIPCCKIRGYLLYIVHNYWQESLKQTDREEEEKLSKITLYNYFSLSLLSLMAEKQELCNECQRVNKRLLEECVSIEEVKQN